MAVCGGEREAGESIHAMTLGFATCRVVELARVTTQARAPHEEFAERRLVAIGARERLREAAE